MKKFLVLSFVIAAMSFTSACGGPADDAVAKEINEETADIAEDISEDANEDNLAEIIKTEAVSAGSKDLYSLTGVVKDASMNTITIETEQGSTVTFSTDDDTKTEYKDGLLNGINVRITVECDVDKLESDMDVEVVEIKEL